MTMLLASIPDYDSDEEKAKRLKKEREEAMITDDELFKLKPKS